MKIIVVALLLCACGAEESPWCASCVDPEIDWVEVPAGSYTYGSPLDTPCRGAITETEVDVTLTRPFLISRYEVTQKQWKALGFDVPPNAPLCEDCPITFVDFYEAAAWCNRLSELEGLEPCYRLEECSGTLGSGCPETDFYELGCVFMQDMPETTILPDNYYCPGDVRRFASMYDCDGYRLPTTAEWEYAAKAGTTTNTYNGDITYDSNGWCVEEPILEDIAWYCFNSGAGDTNASPDQISEIGLKQANPFGLYDMLGNVQEWVDYRATGGALNQGSPGEALTDPIGEPWPNDWEIPASTRGGSFSDVGCYNRSAWRLDFFSFARMANVGFRPVRTLPAPAPDAGAK